MHIIVETRKNICYGDEANLEGELKLPFDPQPFACLIWDHGGGISVEQKIHVCTEVLHAGCRYAVCGGKDCEQWHDIFDEIHVYDHLGDSEEALEANFVDTTWHTDQSVGEVAWFFATMTNYSGRNFDKYLVLQIGSKKDMRQVDQAVRLQFETPTNV